MRIDNSTFLISGGASGLGAACARLLAGSGGNVVIADVNRQDGEALAAALGARARFAQTDVIDEAAVQAAVDLAREAFGGVQGCINCAGVAIAERVLARDQ